MKLPTIALLIMISTTTFGQILGPKEKAIIYLKNGEKKDGFVKDSKLNVKFKFDKKDEDIQKIRLEEIDSIDYEKQETIYYRPLDNTNGEVLRVRQIYSGKTKLYYHYERAFDNGAYRVFFVQGEEAYLTKIFPVGILGNGSDKAMIAYFADCPKLTQHIQKRTFEKYVNNQPKYKKARTPGRLTEIVKFYDSNCNK